MSNRELCRDELLALLREVSNIRQALNSKPSSPHLAAGTFLLRPEQEYIVTPFIGSNLSAGPSAFYWHCQCRQSYCLSCLYWVISNGQHPWIFPGEILFVLTELSIPNHATFASSHSSTVPLWFTSLIASTWAPDKLTLAQNIPSSNPLYLPVRTSDSVCAWQRTPFLHLFSIKLLL